MSASQGNIKLLNIDCMEYMATLPDKAFDLAIVDPPYRDNNQPTMDMRERGSMVTLSGRPLQKYWDELKRVSREQIIFGANNFELPQYKGFIIWDKEIPFDFTMSMAEMAAISEGLGTISKIFKYRSAGSENKIHPTQKPVALYKWLLKNYAKEGDRILDTHLGSGSSAIAAFDFKAKEFVGCEIDKDYYNAAVNRFRIHTSQYQLF